MNCNGTAGKQNLAGSLAERLRGTLTKSTALEQMPTVEIPVATRKFPEERILELYIRCLGRKPSKEELDKLLPNLGEGANQQKAYEDIFWALLNSREFLFNH